jgi:hypothetical protein
MNDSKSVFMVAQEAGGIIVWRGIIHFIIPQQRSSDLSPIEKTSDNDVAGLGVAEEKIPIKKVSVLLLFHFQNHIKQKKILKLTALDLFVFLSTMIRFLLLVIESVIISIQWNIVKFQ